jgi:poly-beta-1,6-N-acetyl-D-glucosamine synthase
MHSQGNSDPSVATSHLVLITPAKNEESFLYTLVESVLSQTLRPILWLIVDDGSTDNTSQVVERYARKHTWIKLLKTDQTLGRSFCSKARAFNYAYRNIASHTFHFVANVDADISIPDDYFAFLLDQFKKDPRLGVAGTRYTDGAYGISRVRRLGRSDDVCGAVQLFRRECIDEIGGYVESGRGAIDSVAGAEARLRGWRTRTFEERLFIHHRGCAASTFLSHVSGRFKFGEKAHSLGSHPAWELARVFSQLLRPPIAIGGVIFAFGFLTATLRNCPRAASPAVVEFVRAEQRARIKLILRRLIRPRTTKVIRYDMNKAASWSGAQFLRDVTLRVFDMLHSGWIRLKPTDGTYRVVGDWNDCIDKPCNVPRYNVLVALVGGRSSVLEIGAGVGTFGAHLLKRYPLCRYLGVERSEAAAAHAIELLGRDSIVCSSAEEFRLDLGSYDSILFNDMLYYCADPVGLLRRYRSVLRENGIIIVAIFMRPGVPGWSQRLRHIIDPRRPMCNTHCAAMIHSEFQNRSWNVKHTEDVYYPDGDHYSRIWCVNKRRSLPRI